MWQVFICEIQNGEGNVREDYFGPVNVGQKLDHVYP